VLGRGGRDAKNSPQRRPPFHRYLRYMRFPLTGGSGIYTSIKYMPLRCTLMRYTPVRYTPMRCTPMRYMLALVCHLATWGLPS
jgi:hypothetical protein